MDKFGIKFKGLGGMFNKVTVIFKDVGLKLRSVLISGFWKINSFWKRLGLMKRFQNLGNMYKIVVVLVLLVSTILLAGNVLKKPQTPNRIFSSGETVNFSFSPDALTFPGAGSTQLMLAAATNKISAVNIEIDFDYTKVKLASEVTVATALPYLLPGNTTMASANTTGKLIIHLGKTPGTTNDPTGTFNVATLIWAPATTLTDVVAQVGVNTSTTTVVDNTTPSNPQYVPVTANSLNISINPVATPTPKATATPTPKATATPTPTGVPGSAVFWDDLDPVKEIWTHNAALGTDDWQLSTKYSKSSTHSYFVSEPSTIKDDYLITRSINVSANALLTFWHTYQLEYTGDGAVIEISTDGGSTFTDLGSKITGGGYTDTIDTEWDSPIGGRMAWTGGTLGTMTKVTVNLASYSGKSVKIRFRAAMDEGTSGLGWYIDDILVTAPGVNPTPTTSCNKADISGPLGVPDCIVNIYDISAVIQNYNWKGSAGGNIADINGSFGVPDGAVNIYDISMVVQNYGK